MAGTSYTRQSTITDGNLITAAIFNNEYNQLLNAFAYATSSTTGHQHDGSAGQGGNIAKIGDQDFKNKVVISATNNRIEFYSEVSNSPVEQVRIQDGLITPVTDSDVDLGTTSVRFKDAFVDSVTVTNNIVVGGTVDGRDVATDGTKLDGVEASATADQTNAEIRTAVEAASDSNVFTDADHSKLNAIEASATADQTDAQIRAAVEAATDSNVFTDADHTKLNAIEASADVTDTANVTAAGALMDSEVTNLAQVKAFASSDYATAAQGVLAAAALPKSGGAMTGAITTNSTFDGRDVATDGTKLDGIEASATADQTAAEIRAAVEAATNSNVFTDADHSKLNALEASGDVTDTANVTAAGALMDSELTSIASVKALNQGVATTNSPTFAAVTVAGEITANGGIALGDNDKATFGAGDDLQIYHDGSNSYIKDAGTGTLNLQGATQVLIGSATTGEVGLQFVENAGVNLRHNNVNKFATTATGIDVTGTATMDGLTVEAASNALIRVSDSTNANQRLDLTHNAGNAKVISGNNGAYGAINLQAYNGTDTINRLGIAANGDISFFEDTGSARKFFWDASAESLGLGTSSPSRPLHISTAVDTVALFESTDSNSRIELKDGAGSSLVENGGGILRLKADSANAAANSRIDFTIDNSEKMRITTTGNVGIGTASPSAALDVNGTIEFNGLSGTGAVTVTNFLDEDNMASNSATALATQQSIKAYVDANAGGAGGGETLQQTLAIGNTVTTDTKIQFRDTGLYINSSADGQLDIVADTEIQIAATTVDLNGALDVSGNIVVAGTVDGVDIATRDGVLSSTTTTAGAALPKSGGAMTGAITVGVDDTGYDVQFFGATAGKSLLWDESADSLIVTGDIKITQAAGGTFLKFDVDGTTDEATVGMDATDLIISIDPTNARASSDFIIKNDGTETFRIAANGVATFAGEIKATGGIDVTGVTVTDGITSSAPMTITTADNAAQITLISTDADASVGPLIDLTRDSASPAVDDTLGRLRFRGEDANGDVTAYAQIQANIKDVSAGAVGGALAFLTPTAGSMKNRLNLQADELVINESSEDYDFRVESNGNTHALFVEASSGNIGVGTSSPATLLDVDGTLTTNALVVEGGITEDAVTLTGTSTTIDISAATNFVHDLTGATTYTFSNPASTGNASSFTLKIIQDSTARAITWPNTVDWAGGTAPTLTGTNNGVDVFVFYTIDGGTIYYGFTAGQAMA